ncbi:hypothetical protein BKA82DRAFT_1003359 [Pisolithus tinctorius]|uniref:Uncharacterized protein n=1 Tax=Pisolithus tinctorius Marx 270 TaxID=870435 RepID=A0A0C3IW58_PISTI|nr:hypothetical protein BKA82DRAFT_1003359 [Pisolithus tinctorius]KIO01068.1 hypothetical protein M404DRAFT_1003359 [Pisolithus tinctorius Marx 270]
MGSARRITRPEDVVYSLCGVFDLHLPILYGESADKALERPSAEITSQSGDVSVLGWVGEVSSFHSCFPTNLMSYQTTPCVQSTSRDLSRRSREAMDLKRAGKLWSDLAELPFPQFINHTLKLPSIVHQVTVMKPGATPTPQTHAYEIQASAPGANPAHVSQTWRFGHQVAIHSCPPMASQVA